MAEYDLKLLQKHMKEELSADRFEHTLGVMYTAESLAMRYGADMTKAAVAGLLHDCAKCIPNSQKLKMCKKHDIEITEMEEQNPSLLHAKLGAYMAKKAYGVEDEEILSAIRWHTTGKPDMSLLDIIIYMADYIEPYMDSLFEKSKQDELELKKQELEAKRAELEKRKRDLLTRQQQMKNNK